MTSITWVRSVIIAFLKILKKYFKKVVVYDNFLPYLYVIVIKRMKKIKIMKRQIDITGYSRREVISMALAEGLSKSTGYLAYRRGWLTMETEKTPIKNG